MTQTNLPLKTPTSGHQGTGEKRFQRKFVLLVQIGVSLADTMRPQQLHFLFKDLFVYLENSLPGPLFHTSMNPLRDLYLTPATPALHSCYQRIGRLSNLMVSFQLGTGFIFINGYKTGPINDQNKTYAVVCIQINSRNVP